MQTLIKHLDQFRKGSPLSFRLLAYILLFSSIFTLLTTGIQVYSDFRKDVYLIEERMGVIQTSYANSLSRSLWSLDQNLLKVQMEGILQLPDIVHLRLRIFPESEIVMGGLPRDIATRSLTLPLIHRDDQVYELGELTITASLEQTYRNLRQKISLILTTQFFKTFFISIFILWIFQHFVTRHLSTMGSFARRFSLENVNEPLVLARPRRQDTAQDELDQMTDAFNQMRERLRQDILRQEKDANEIRKLSMAIEQSPSSVLICDKNWHVEFANQKFTQLSGYSAPEIIGKHPSMLTGDAHAPQENHRFWNNIQLQVKRVGVWQGEINSLRKSGERFWEQVIITPIKDEHGRPTHYLILGEDISIRKRYEQQLLRQANYDILTGLPNRMLAMDRLKLALAQARRDESLVGVMFLDLDNFKHINDTMGHDAGDTLLIEAARRISSCLRGTSTVARLGGDEFLVILPGLKEADGAIQVAERILQTFAVPYDLNGQEVFVTTSIGIAIYPTDSDNSGTLLQHADAAMYEAKNKGKSAYERFAPEMREVSQERLQIESRLRRALELNEFELHYQPIVRTQTGKVMGAEALLRWNNPSMGMVMPDKFIPLAEETGLITAIGDWVIEEACQAVRRWQDATGQPLSIAVNVSPRQFRDPRFVDTVLHAIEKSGIKPSQLELEITERLILDNTIETADILHRLDAHHVRLSVDDFGTGYSALSYLKSYPFDTLKIDKAFIRDVTLEEGDAALVNAIINMAHSLGLEVVAEGVETQDQGEFLAAQSCDFAQGYFYNRPVAEDSFLAWLRERAPVSSS
ncbi:MAG: EAL domain-containing protein [Marinobacter sp.]|nr:EAL domain-containing protein [Marinobacter sp.]